MSIRQLTLIRFKSSITEDDFRAVERGFAGLRDLVPGMQRMDFGRDLKIMPGSYDFGLVIDFDSEESWQAYQQHPEHQKFAATFVPLAEDAVRVQFEIA